MARRGINRLARLESVPSRAAGVLQGFAVVPMQLTPAQVAWQQHVYRLAAERARRALEPPRYVRQFLASWN